MKKITLGIMAFGVVLASCKKETKVLTTAQDPPVACFSAIKKSPIIAREYAFGADCSEGVASCLWYFGDGDSASGLNVVHTYYSKGVHDVVLTITNAKGEISKAKKIIDVIDLRDTISGSYSGMLKYGSGATASS